MVQDFDQMTNVKKETISLLKEHFYIPKYEVIKCLEDTDLTTKFLFKLSDGNIIETVIMKFDYGNSICVTTQVGCNMGCKFCASGQLKKVRNLESGEIVNQLMEANKYLVSHNRDTIRRFMNNYSKQGGNY